MTHYSYADFALDLESAHAQWGVVRSGRPERASGTAWGAMSAIAAARIDFQEQIHRLSPVLQAALARKGQRLWSATRLAATQRTTLVDWIASIPIERLGDVDTIIDLGAGDGQVAEAVLQTSFGRRVRNVLLIDCDSGALDLAKRRLSPKLLPADKVVTDCRDIRDLTIWHTNHARTSVVLASSTLHKLNGPEKAMTMRSIADNSIGLILSELVADDECPTSPIPVLRDQETSFYNALIADAYESLPSEHQFATIGAFLLGEFEALTTRPYREGQTYHLDPGKWRETAEVAGLTVFTEEVAKLLAAGPAGYFMFAGRPV